MNTYILYNGFSMYGNTAMGFEQDFFFDKDVTNQNFELLYKGSHYDPIRNR